jgi:hypothetical protein
VTTLNIVFVVIALAAVAYDVWLTTDKIEGNTFSELLRADMMVTPIIPWVLAFMAGRWFHPWQKESEARWISSNVPDATTLFYAALLTCAVAIAGAVYKQIRGSEHFIPPWIVILFGLVAGATVAPLPSM